MSGKDFLIDNDSNSKSSLNAHSPINMRRVFSGSTNVLTDGDQERIHSTVSVRKIKRADLEPVNNVDKFNESKTTYLQSTSIDDNREENSNIQRFGVTVARVIKSANIEKSNKINSNRIEPQIASLEATAGQKNVLVHVIKIPRPRTSSAGKTNVTHADGCSMEMKTIGTRAKTAIPTNDRKEMTGSAVRVKKVSRKDLTNGSNDT